MHLKHKSEVLKCFKRYRRLAENKSGKKIKVLRSDQGTEFTNGAFEDYLEKHGIHHQMAATRTPQQNGVVERKNRAVVEMARTLLLESKLHTRFWTEATFTVMHLLNRVLLRPSANQTPYEL